MRPLRHRFVFAVACLALSLPAFAQQKPDARPLGKKPAEPPALNFITARLTEIEADKLTEKGRYAEAEPKYRQILDYYRKTKGEDDAITGAAYFTMGYNLYSQSKNAEAQPFFEAALTNCLKRKYARIEAGQTYNALAINLSEMGRFAESDQYLDKALEIFSKGGKETESNLLAVLNTRGNSMRDRGHYALAEPDHRKAIALELRTSGDNTEDLAACYSNLSLDLLGQGKYEEAEFYLKKALQILRKLGKSETPDAVIYYNHLGLVNSRRGNMKKAEEVYRDSLRILGKVDKQSADYGRTLSNVASVLDEKTRSTESIALSHEALAIHKKVIGPRHPVTTQTMNNLAHYEGASGDLAGAEKLYREVLAIRKEVLGEYHPDTVEAYRNLGQILRAEGRYPEAEESFAAAVERFEKVRRRASPEGFGRIEYTSRYSPQIYLAAMLARRQRPREAFNHIEAFLARGLFDEVSRPLADKEREREQQFLWKMRKLDEKLIPALANPKFAGQNSVAGRKIEDLRREREMITDEFAQFEKELEAKYGVEAGRHYDLAKIEDLLPPNAALITWVDIDAAPFAADPHGEHWACLVRKDKEPAWIRIPGVSPDGNWREKDIEDIKDFKVVLASKETEGHDWVELASSLARQRFEPLRPFIQGGDGQPPIEHLIVLPSNALGVVPLEPILAAWKGTPHPIRISYAPSCTMWANLTEKAQKSNRARKERLFALGDPVYASSDESKANAQAARDRDSLVRPLGYTRDEIQLISGFFPVVPTLALGAEATAGRLKEEAATGRLRSYDYVHLATHAKSSGGNAMRSVLILGQEPEADPLAAGPAPLRNSRIYAEEILRTWELNADLVTLSACETGLGRYAVGEGYLGFSQALFLAGSRSVLLSLWNADDLASTLLMVRFYRNLLMPRSNGVILSKAEALDEAKNWLRSLSRQKAMVLRQALREKESVYVLRFDEVETHSDTDRPFAHPYYWAGFILIGDSGQKKETGPALNATAMEVSNGPVGQGASPPSFVFSPLAPVIIVMLIGALIAGAVTLAVFRRQGPKRSG